MAFNRKFFSFDITFVSYDFIYFYLDEAPTSAPAPGKFHKTHLKSWSALFVERLILENFESRFDFEIRPFLLRGESSIDFRTQYVIMTLTDEGRSLMTFQN